MAILSEELIRSNSYLPHKDLYPVFRSLSRTSTAHALRMMYLLHSVVSEHPPLLNTTIRWHISIDFLRYLGISGEPDPMASLEYLLHQITSAPIPRIRRKDNLRTWDSSPWLVYYKVIEASRTLELKLNPNISDYWDLLQALTPAKPISLQRLSRSFPMWLYVVLLNAKQYGDYWVVDTADFCSVSMFDDRAAFPEKDRVSKMFASGLGARSNPVGVEEYRASRKEKRPPRFVPWLFSAKTGNIQTIRSKSELLVNICPIKIKGVLSYFAFSFLEEDDNGFDSGDVSEHIKSLTFGEELQQSKLLDTLFVK